MADDLDSHYGTIISRIIDGGVVCLIGGGISLCYNTGREKRGRKAGKVICPLSRPRSRVLG